MKHVLGYMLRPGENLHGASARLGAAGEGRVLSGSFVELPVPIDLDQKLSAKASTLSEVELAKSFPGAQISRSNTGGITTWRVATDAESFDVTVRGDRIYVTTFDGFGGFDELGEQPLAQSLKRAHDAYRAVVSARAL